jgi:preprotein translocase subunit SecG
MIYGVLIFVHIVICFFLMIVVLLQSGKAADLAGAFGGMGSQTAFGPRGSATILSKATEIAAGLFMVTSLTLAIWATKGTASVGHSVLETSPIKTTAPMSPGPARGAPAPLAPTVGGGGSSQPIPIPMQRQGTPVPNQPAPSKK